MIGTDGLCETAVPCSSIWSYMHALCKATDAHFPRQHLCCPVHFVAATSCRSCSEAVALRAFGDAILLGGQLPVMLCSSGTPCSATVTTSGAGWVISAATASTQLILAQLDHALWCQSCTQTAACSVLCCCCHVYTAHWTGGSPIQQQFVFI